MKILVDNSNSKMNSNSKLFYRVVSYKTKNIFECM